MSKIDLNDTNSGYNRSAINTNFQRIKDFIDTYVLLRKSIPGEANTVENDIDFNGKRILNLPTPLSLNEPARLQDLKDRTNGGIGTVISVGVNSANGFSGTVSSPTSTPIITLTTPLTGVLKGSAGGLIQAVSGTDFAPATSGTSILYANGSGGFNSVTIGSGITFSSGTLSASSGAGSVTSTSVVSANGFAGTVANPTTTPAITITTTLSGVIKGNGTALSVATAGSDYSTPSGTETLSNKRITVRVGSTTSSATPAINTDNFDIYKLTAQAVDITSFTTNLTGTPTDGQCLIIQITGTAARAITWGASFEASTVALPTTTVTTAMLAVAFIYNSITSKWRCVGVV